MDWPEQGKLPVARKKVITFLTSKKMWVNLVKYVCFLSVSIPSYAFPSCVPGEV